MRLAITIGFRGPAIPVPIFSLRTHTRPQLGTIPTFLIGRTRSVWVHSDQNRIGAAQTTHESTASLCLHPKRTLTVTTLPARLWEVGCAFFQRKSPRNILLNCSASSSLLSCLIFLEIHDLILYRIRGLFDPYEAKIELSTGEGG